ncbi:MAG: hypothetical protein WAU78_00920 [Roseiarcus sp.]
MKGIDDWALARAAAVFAAEAVGLVRADFRPEPLFAADPGDAFEAALTLCRAIGLVDGEALFVFLARRKALTMKEEAWETLAEPARLYFAIAARVLAALARGDDVGAEKPATRIVKAKPPEKRDTIFERNGMKDQIFEKTGGEDLSPGQPTSTAEVHIETPEFHASGVEANYAALAARAAAAGMPISTPEGDAADTLKRLGHAPPAAPFERLRVNRFVDGAPIAGEVFISKPSLPAASAPAAPSEPAAAGSSSAAAGKKKGKR